MNLSTRAKIALGLGVLLVLALVLVFWFNKKNSSNDLEPDQTPLSGNIFAPSTTTTSNGDQNSASPTATGSASGDQINYVSPTSTSSVSAKVGASPRVAVRTPNSTVYPGGVRVSTVEVTPVPNAGFFDWTRQGAYKIADFSNSKLASKTSCEVLGLDSSWKNAIEKMSCDTINFFSGTILQSLSELSCTVSAAALQLNFNNDITYEYKDNRCMIIDRNNA